MLYIIWQLLVIMLEIGGIIIIITLLICDKGSVIKNEKPKTPRPCKPTPGAPPKKYN